MSCPGLPSAGVQGLSSLVNCKGGRGAEEEYFSLVNCKGGRGAVEGVVCYGAGGFLRGGFEPGGLSAQMVPQAAMECAPLRVLT